MSKLAITLTILGIYLVVALVIGFYGYWKSRQTPDDYFLADRNVGPFVLFFTLMGTNFSAFLFLGFAAKGYQVGYGFYCIMGFGTAFIAPAFYFIGYKVWKLGREKGYITPPEFICDRFGSEPLKILFLAVMVIFTLPYLALQPIGAGILVNTLTDGWIPEFTGAVILTVVMVLYVFLGGMRSIAWTDVFQGLMVLVFSVVALVAISSSLGGMESANQRVFEMEKGLFTRGKFTYQTWFSWMILWIFVVPMFPQMFMRFFLARDKKSLQVSAILYPVVTGILFIFPVAIGVLGHIDFPSLVGKEADTILPRLLNLHASAGLAALIMVGALAAFMSTMDSQLLALSSMLTRDIYLDFINKEASLDRQVFWGRVFIVILAVIGLAISYFRPAAIFVIVKWAFTGLAVLFPTVIAALYSPKTGGIPCILSIVAGEGLLIGFLMGWIPNGWTMGFLPAIPIIAVSAAVVWLGTVVAPVAEGAGEDG